jgi:hypothetical protein
VKGFFASIGRWPLLTGAVILFLFALWEESHNTYGHTTVAIVSLAIGAVLLGAWVYSVAIESKSPHHDKKEESDEQHPADH